MSAVATTTETTSAQRSQIRRIVGRSRCNNIPVAVIDGNSSPKLSGKPGGWFTRGGTPIAHPSAYSRSGWSNMMYVRSSEAIEVGAEWILKNL